MKGSDFLDTNVVIYYASNDEPKARRSMGLLEAGATISVQVLNEFCRATLGKMALSYQDVHTTLNAVRLVCDVVPLTVETHVLALEYAERHRLNIYDANIVAAAVLAGCTTLWSEDMHNGLAIDGLTIRDPYSS